MTNLTNRLNMKFGKVAHAHVMNHVNLGLAAYDTLCLICADLEINLDDVSDVDFEACSDALEAFCNNSNDDTGYTVSVWFD